MFINISILSSRKIILSLQIHTFENESNWFDLVTGQHFNVDIVSNKNLDKNF